MFIELGELKIHYKVEGQGPILILLHGWGCNINSMFPLINSLKTSNRVYALDLPNFGESSKLNSFDSFVVADIVIKFIQKLKLLDITLIGYSFGGKVSSIVASKTKVNKLILISSPGIKYTSYIKQFKNLILKIFKKITTNIFFLNKNKVIFKFLRNKISSEDYRNCDDRLKGSFKSIINEDLSKIFSNIENKTLIIQGIKDDKVLLKVAHKINSLIKNSKLIIIEDDHYCLKNKIVLQEIKKFIGE